MLKWISDPVVCFWCWHKPSVSSLQFGDPKLPCCLPFAGCYRLADCARVLKRVTQEQQWLSFKVGGGGRGVWWRRMTSSLESVIQLCVCLKDSMSVIILFCGYVSCFRSFHLWCDWQHLLLPHLPSVCLSDVLQRCSSAQRQERCSDQEEQTVIMNYTHLVAAVTLALMPSNSRLSTVRYLPTDYSNGPQ